MNELWALLWSKKSNGFHMEMLDQTVKAGRKFFANNASDDYLLIGVGTYAEVDALADELRPTVIARSRKAA